MDSFILLFVFVLAIVRRRRRKRKVWGSNFEYLHESDEWLDFVEYGGPETKQALVTAFLQWLEAGVRKDCVANAHTSKKKARHRVDPVLGFRGSSSWCERVQDYVAEEGHRMEELSEEICPVATRSLWFATGWTRSSRKCARPV